MNRYVGVVRELKIQIFLFTVKNPVAAWSISKT